MSPRPPTNLVPGTTTFRLDDIPLPMVHATHRIIRDCNSEFSSLFGYMWGTHLSGGKTYYDERIMMSRDGRTFWCSVNGKSRHSSDPFADALYCFEPMNRPVSQTMAAITDRQRQILTLIAQGKTSEEIARELGLSRRTIETHRLRLCRTAAVRNSFELVAWFLSQEGSRET
jgi:DNA-binding CsgD family transcriptional regulator